MHKRALLGRHGEEIACRFLVEQGLAIVDRNWRCREGEIDIVARQGDTLVFVEVRTRRSARFGVPEESVTAAKQAHLVAACHAFLAQCGQPDVAWQIDFVAIEMDTCGQVTRFNRIQHAF